MGRLVELGPRGIRVELDNGHRVSALLSQWSTPGFEPVLGEPIRIEISEDEREGWRHAPRPGPRPRALDAALPQRSAP